MRSWLLVFTLLLLGIVPPAEAGPPVFPTENWQTRSPTEAHLDGPSLEALAKLVGGRGCVVRDGFMVYSWGDQSKSSDVASAFKPLLTTLLFMAIQEGKLAGVDARVSDFEPRLKELNAGKDGAITWRHLANQISGYGLAEAPGTAYSYNDYALTLYYDTLMNQVFREDGTQVLKTRLAEPLGFQDPFTFDAFHRKDRLGRLALSVRDFARFGWLYLNHGAWCGRQLVRTDLVQLATSSPLPPAFPRTSGRFADMIAGQHSIGGSRNITPIGPGFYSFNWWLNGTNSAGQRLFEDAPLDTFVASGHGGMRTLWMFPAWKLVVCWNDSRISDHDKSPGNSASECNQAAHLIATAVRKWGKVQE